MMNKDELYDWNYRDGDKSMTKVYRLMIYFAHSTMVIYDKTITTSPLMTPAEMYNENKAVMTRVFDEGMNIMFYELSHRQMIIACSVYLRSKYHPQSVKEIPAYTLKD